MAAEPPARKVKAVPTPARPVAAVAKTVQRPDQKRDGKAVRKPGSVPVHKVVRKGDTLPKLVLKTYGSINQNLIELVRHNNPGIAMDNLQGGERIYFPSREYR